jgi:hypothetical protein
VAEPCATTPGYEPKAWIGIVPSPVTPGSEEVNDKHDLVYQYLQGRRSGRLVFTAPARPGS